MNMTTETRYLRDLVTVDGDFKPSVQLPFDFEHPGFNERLLRNFIPTTQSIEILTQIAQSLDPNSTERARAIVGTFGTGKSDLLLMICNYFGRSIDDPLMADLYARMDMIDPSRTGIIKGRREGKPPFLVVLLQADTVSSFPGFVLHGLQQALERVQLTHLMAKTRYAAAHEQIVRWQQEGHQRYADFCNTLEEHERINITSLLAALNGPQADDALARFRRTFHTIMGLDFSILGYSQPHEAFASVAEALVATGQYSGILLVCDEFTAFLERSQGAIDQQLREFEAETKAVENLAERSVSSGKAQVHFIVASLESFASAAGRIGSAAVAQTTERSGGRFKQHSLQVEGSEELIRGTIKPVPGADQIVRLPNAQRDELLGIAEEVWRQNQFRAQSREWIRKVIVDGSFPLHPYSTYALPLVNQRVAQSQRTMFIFLNDEKGLRGFIQREQLQSEYPGWHNLLTLDHLFDYFRDSINTKYSDIHESYERAEQQVRTATLGKELATRILKIVALCETVGSDLTLRPTRMFLRHALNLPPSAEPDLDTALNLLEQLDAIEVPSEIGNDAGVYRLPARGWVSTRNLKQRITNRAKNQPATDVGKLQSQHAPDAIVATEYNRKRGSHRKLSAYYISVANARSRTRLENDLSTVGQRDGLLWYVITSSDAERAEAQSLARELTATNPQLVVAVPVMATQILSALRNYEALCSLRNDPELDQQSKPYLEDTGKVGRDYKHQLDYELNQLKDPKQWEWFAGGQSRTNQNAALVSGLASNVMDKVFPDTPATGLAQHFKPNDLGNTLIRAVEQIIKGDIQIAKASNAQADSVLRTGAVTLGLLQVDKAVGSYEHYRTTDPTSSANLASGTIWRRINDHLAAGKAWSTLVQELRQPPFGLYDSLLIFFLAIFVTRNADSLAITAGKPSAGGRPLDIDSNLLKKMLEKPQDYTVRYYKMTDAEKRWLRSIVEQGLRRPEFNPPPGTPLRNAAASQFKTWLTKQQLPAFVTSLAVEDIATFLPDNDAVAIQTVHLLLQNASSSESELANVLLTEVPLLLGAPEQRKAWDQATVDALIASWMRVCDLLRQLPEALKEATLQRVAALFGAEAYSGADRWHAIYRWRSHRKAVSADRLQSMARDLFRFTNAVNGSIEQNLLDEFARRVITVGVEYQRWQNLDKFTKVLSELTKARDEINRAWEDVAHGDEVWREGLMRIASGRIVSGVSAEQVAIALAAWSTGLQWPACVGSLTTPQVALLYPEHQAEVIQDLVRLLKRANYTQEQWHADIQEVLPKEFGVQGYTRNEVNTAITRLQTVLPLASSLDARLRQYIQAQVVRLFAASIGLNADTSPTEALAQWKERHAIPEPNDLSAEAKGLLFHIGNEAANLEHLLLNTIPRTLSGVERPTHQWERFDLLESYTTELRRLLNEISSYEPLTPAVDMWLRGVIEALRQPAPTHLPYERKRLTAIVATIMSNWLQVQQLPPFVADLDTDELHAIVPTADQVTCTALACFLRRNANATTHVLISQELPAVFGLNRSDASWEEPRVEAALHALERTCRLLEALPNLLRERLFNEISHVFALAAMPLTSAQLLAHLRTWRANYVILPNDPLSSDARLLYDTLGSSDNDAEGVLLQRLPTRIAEVRAPYDKWSQWSLRECYLNALQSAAQEIIQHGQVGSGSQSADSLWQEFRKRLDTLGDDERRWIVKTFRDEFQQ